jgi:hypothetical protein
MDTPCCPESVRVSAVCEELVMGHFGRCLKNGLNHSRKLTEALLQSGTSPDEVLSVWGRSGDVTGALEG